MDQEIEIFFNNIRLLGAEVLDLEAVVGQYRVPVNTQMFQKTNPKGMAILLKPLLCFFDPDKYDQLFEGCWFPFGLAQMKPFKETCVFVSSEIQQIPQGLITKPLLESSSG